MQIRTCRGGRWWGGSSGTAAWGAERELLGRWPCVCTLWPTQFCATSAGSRGTESGSLHQAESICNNQGCWPFCQGEACGQREAGSLSNDIELLIRAASCNWHQSPSLAQAQRDPGRFAGPRGKPTDARSRDLVGAVQTMLPTSWGCLARHVPSLSPLTAVSCGPPSCEPEHWYTNRWASQLMPVAAGRGGSLGDAGWKRAQGQGWLCPAAERSAQC